MLAVGVVVTVGLTAAVGATWVGAKGTGVPPSAAAAPTTFLRDRCRACLSLRISESRFRTSSSLF